MDAAALVIADTEGLDALVRGESLLVHAVRGALGSGCVSHLTVAAPKHLVGTYEKLVRSVPGTESRCRVLPCSGTRAESIRLAWESASTPTPPDVVLVCDATRPFVPSGLVREVAETVFREDVSVVPVQPVTDTVKLVNAQSVIIATEDRSSLRTVQAPFGCRPAMLSELCARGIDPLREPPAEVRTIPGHQNGLRLRTQFDMSVAEALLTEELV
jgi:2-C-methyl-D-erythritol 4-phosphate cytidylyltransferase